MEWNICVGEPTASEGQCGSVEAGAGEPRPWGALPGTLAGRCMWLFPAALPFTFFFLIFLFIYLFILISWRLITLQYCSGFCHTLT